MPLPRAVLIAAVAVAIAHAVKAQSAPRADSSPMLHPELFGPGVFSTGAWDFFVAFTPDGNTAYVNRANGSFSHFTIVKTRAVTVLRLYTSNHVFLCAGCG